MKFLSTAAASILAACMFLSAPARAIGEAALISSAPGTGVVLIDNGRVASMHVDSGDHAGVLRAARSLQRDIEKVSGKRPALGEGVVRKASDVILIGTLGRSPMIDRLVAAGKLDVSQTKHQWEGYVVQAVEAPEPGIDRALVIAGSDKRGTIFGIYTLSEQLGVSPWYWWADVPVPRRARAIVPLSTRLVDRPVVQYRGIFLNDEAPALTNWAKATFGGFNRHFYERLFELMLRMKANYLWPAMWYSAFNTDDKDNPRLADEMGIVMGTSHHEPMMRSQQEWHRYGKGAWDYEKNGEGLRKFWSEGIRAARDHESLITMAMRGDGDEPMSEHANVALLERIVQDQRRIIGEETGKDPAKVPQLWALYKEVQEYYEKGMKVPDDMLLLFADDNYGNIRRLPTEADRKRSGGAGVYYHFDYVGDPRSYKWLNVTQISKVWHQMSLANAFGANRLWIVNVGDLKPMEIPTEFFMHLAWNPAKWPADKLDTYLRLWAERDFGAQHAQEIAGIVAKYTQFNARRRPEQVDPNTYSLLHYREAERVVAEYRSLADRAKRIAAALKPNQRAAFFQLVEYPVLASANALDMHASAGLNRLYATQGRISTNDMADRVHALFAYDAELARKYQHGISNGKWKHMMSQTRFGYTNWDQPYRDVMPAVSRLRVPERGELAAPNGIHPVDQMGIMVEGTEQSWPAFPIKPLVLPELDAFEKQPRYIELFNRSREPYQYDIGADQPWVKLNRAQGKVEKVQRIEVDIDWAAAPKGKSRATLTVAGPGGAKVKIGVPVHNPASSGTDAVQGHVETGGVIAIEAEHFSTAAAAPGRDWLRIPGYGRTLSGMTTTPLAAPSVSTNDGMRLEYVVHLFNPGQLRVEAVLGTTLKFLPGAGFRYAIAIDDEPPQVINVHSDESKAYWSRLVSEGVGKFSTTHAVKASGRHVIKFWPLDPGLVLQRIVVNAGGLKPSYLGPPESPRLPVRP